MDLGHSESILESFLIDDDWYIVFLIQSLTPFQLEDLNKTWYILQIQICLFYFQGVNIQVL